MRISKDRAAAIDWDLPLQADLLLVTKPGVKDNDGDT